MDLLLVFIAVLLQFLTYRAIVVEEGGLICGADSCKNTVILCPNTINNCSISCNKELSCQNSTIYSGAVTTTVSCFVGNSCNDTKIFCGDLSLASNYNLWYPDGYSFKNLTRDGKDKISCNVISYEPYGFSQSFLGCYGNVIDQCIINGSSGANDEIFNSTFDCNTQWTSGKSDCIVNCIGIDCSVDINCYATEETFSNQCKCVTDSDTIATTTTTTTTTTITTMYPSASPITTTSTTRITTGATAGTTAPATTSISTTGAGISTARPTTRPSDNPAPLPTSEPSFSPTSAPTSAPMSDPTVNPTVDPTVRPTERPSERPTEYPSPLPTHPNTPFSTASTGDDDDDDDDDDFEFNFDFNWDNNNNDNNDNNNNRNRRYLSGATCRINVLEVSYAPSAEPTTRMFTSTNGARIDTTSSGFNYFNNSNNRSSHDSISSQVEKELIDDIEWVVALLVSVCICGLCLVFAITFYRHKLKKANAEVRNEQSKNRALLFVNINKNKTNESLNAPLLSNSLGPENVEMMMQEGMNPNGMEMVKLDNQHKEGMSDNNVTGRLAGAHNMNYNYSHNCNQNVKKHKNNNNNNSNNNNNYDNESVNINVTQGRKEDFGSGLHNVSEAINVHESEVLNEMAGDQSHKPTFGSQSDDGASYQTNGNSKSKTASKSKFNSMANHEQKNRNKDSDLTDIDPHMTIGSGDEMDNNDNDILAGDNPIGDDMITMGL